MLESIVFNEAGLVPVITRDAGSGEVLMFAWMNRAALEETVTTGCATYYSRSRQRLWRKGESSGNTQQVTELRLDCDGDVLLMSVEQRGGIACHTGRASCFYRQLDASGAWQVVAPVIRPPEELYGASGESESTGRGIS